MINEVFCFHKIIHHHPKKIGFLLSPKISLPLKTSSTPTETIRGVLAVPVTLTWCLHKEYAVVPLVTKILECNSQEVKTGSIFPIGAFWTGIEVEVSSATDTTRFQSIMERSISQAKERFGRRLLTLKQRDRVLKSDEWSLKNTINHTCFSIK